MTKVFSPLLSLNLSAWEERMFARALLIEPAKLPTCVASEHQVQFGTLKQALRALPQEWTRELILSFLQEVGELPSGSIEE